MEARRVSRPVCGPFVTAARVGKGAGLICLRLKTACPS